MKRMLKRVLCLILLSVMLVTVTGCGDNPEEDFRILAQLYFDGYASMHTKTQSDTVIEYSETGSFACQTPRLDAPEADAVIDEYCQGLKAEFQGMAKTEADTLLISYASYKPSDAVTGIEMLSHRMISGAVTEESRIFDFEDGKSAEFSDSFKRITAITASDLLAENAEYSAELRMEACFKPSGYLYTDSGVTVLYDAGTVMPEEYGQIRTEVPYVKVRPVLPDSIKQNVPEDKSVRVVDITKKLVAITFDDGPHRRNTDAILDILETYGSVATFFDVGNQLSEAPDAMRRADAMGCEMGAHSYSHANLKKASPAEIRRQIELTDSAFERVLGKKPEIMRPPYGAIGNDLRNISDEYLIGWSVDSLDWKSRNRDKILAEIARAGDLDGDVILMHSLYETSVEALRELVPGLIEKGYQLVTVSELIKYKYGDTYKKGTYYAYGYFTGK